MSEQSRILVIDDDESIRTVLANIFEELGYFVEGVGTGKEGIEKTQNAFYNLVFVDI
ncbi:MAG: response regulator, partial [Crenarchaeota archaeon]|nr:response regulator [Thermoproteota archaeon]